MQMSHRRLILFPSVIKIDCLYAERQYRKLHIKSPCKIEINRGLNLGVQEIPHVRRLLKLVPQKNKATNHLNVGGLPLDHVKKSSLKKTIKSYYKIKGLTLAWNNSQEKPTKMAYKWLKYLKQLKTLILKSPTSHYYSYGRQKNDIDDLNLKLFRAFKKRKLQNLKILFGQGPGVEFPGINFSNYPPTLRQLTLSWNRSYIDPTSYLSLKENFNISQLKHLQSLELPIPFHLQLLIPLLSSIPNPTKMTGLQINIADREGNKEETIQMINLLNKFTQLKKLNLKFVAWVDIFKGLKEMSQLESLDLTIQIDDQLHLLSLASFIKTLTKLQNLKLLILNNSWTNCFLEKFEKFTQEISKLQLLKSLDIWFWHLGSNAQSKTPGALSTLSKFISSFSNLEDLSLRHSEADYPKEIGALADLLKGTASKLKKLTLEFRDQQLQEEDLQNFLKTLSRLEELQELEIKGLTLLNQDCFELFSKLLCRSKKLVALNLVNIGMPDISGSHIINMLTEVLKKPRFESLCLSESWSATASSRFAEVEKISVKEILERNPKLKLVSIPSYMTGGSVYWGMNQLRWNSGY